MIALILAALLLLPARPTSSFTYACDRAPLLRCTFASTSLGNPNRFTWSWGDGRTESHTQPSATNTWSTPGTYSVRLTVTDSIGGVSYSTQQVTVPKVCTCVDTVKIYVPDTTTKPPPIVVPPPPPTGETWAELPRVYLDTKIVPSTSATISVPAGGNLQAALNAAQPGDVIALANGATFSGTFTLPNKPGASWITIRPASMVGVPPEGVRMSPAAAAAANLPKILSTNNLGAITTDVGAHHWRLIALEVSVPASIPNTGLIRLGTTYEKTLADLPHDLVLDRMYIHGTPTGNNRRCVGLNGASTAVIDSYISECHEAGTDAQAIAGWSGPGPFKIVNNYVEASSENIIFGGSDPLIVGVVPSDIEIRRNHVTRPTSWKGAWHPVKNLLELKSAQRVLVEGNVFENNWMDGQGGSAVNLKSTNQSGGCPWCGTQDVTMRYNLIRNTGSGFNLSANPDPNVVVPMQRVTITDNLVTTIDVAPFNGDGRGFLINGGVIDLTVAHNTVINPTNSAVMFGGPLSQLPVRLTIRDNIVGGGLYGVKGPGLSSTATLAMFLPKFLGNLIITTDASSYPAGTAVPNLAGIGFMSVTDLRLAPTSKYLGKATDGRDPGANVAAVLAAIAGVVVP